MSSASSPSSRSSATGEKRVEVPAHRRHLPRPASSIRPTTSFVFEMTGSAEKLNAFIKLMEPLGLVEVSRTGVVAIARGDGRYERGAAAHMRAAVALPLALLRPAARRKAFGGGQTVIDLETRLRRDDAVSGAGARGGRGGGHAVHGRAGCGEDPRQVRGRTGRGTAISSSARASISASAGCSSR